MKAVPILVISNVIALALVAYLWMGQADLEAKVDNRRTQAERGADPAYDDSSMNEQWKRRMEAELASLRQGAVAEGGGMVPFSGDGSDAPTAVEGGGTETADATAEGTEVTVAADPAMETFRKKVAEANELNREEDRINRVVEDIDKLSADNKIASLSAKKKIRVAKSLLGARGRIPQIWTRIRENNDLRSMPREEMRTLFQTEFDSLKAEAQKDLEGFVAAADAKTIVDESLSRRNMFRGNRTRGDRGR